jgi:DnaB-like helicase C terminal domain
MLLPHTDDLPPLFDEYRITDLGQRSLLHRASWTQHEYRQKLELAQDGQSQKPVLSAIEEAEWQAAEAFWLVVGLVPPVFSWPWHALQRVVGPMLAGEVWVLAARTGDGKSTIVSNLVHQIVWTVRQIYGVTIAPMEQTPAVFKLKMACLHLGFSIPDVFRGRWSHIPDPDAEEKVRAAVASQGGPPLREAIRYSPADTLDRVGMQQLIEQAVRWDHRLVIIDHLHHMDHGTGPENQGIRQTLKLAKKLANQHDIGVWFTAQIGRDDKRDRRRKFYPPDAGDVQGSSAIEQIADCLLLAYQPLKPGMKVKDIDQVILGRQPYRSVFEPNAMGMICGKHRIDGSAKYETINLGFRDGRIRDLPEDEQVDLDDPVVEDAPAHRAPPPAAVVPAEPVLGPGLELGDAYTPGED